MDQVSKPRKRDRFMAFISGRKTPRPHETPGNATPESPDQSLSDHLTTGSRPETPRTPVSPKNATAGYTNQSLSDRLMAESETLQPPVSPGNAATKSTDVPPPPFKRSASFKKDLAMLYMAYPLATNSDLKELVHLIVMISAERKVTSSLSASPILTNLSFSLLLSQKHALASASSLRISPTLTPRKPRRR